MLTTALARWSTQDGTSEKSCLTGPGVAMKERPTQLCDN